MPTGRSTQTSFSGGEFDPLLWSREDVSFFYNSARILENVVPLPQGGGKRREGWRFRALQRGPIFDANLAGATVTTPNGSGLSSGTTTSGTAKTITGVSSADPGVVTAVGHGFTTGNSVYIEGIVGLYARSGTDFTISGATQANPCVLTITAHALATGDLVEITGVVGMTELNGNVYEVTVVDADTVSLNVDASGFTAYSSAGDAEIVTASPVNGQTFTVTVLTADTFELDGVDASILTAYVSGGTAREGVGTTTVYAVWKADFGSAVKLSMIDFGALKAGSLPASVDSLSLILQRSDNNTTWTTVAGISIGTAPYDRRLAAAPNAHLGTARYWRLAVSNSTGADLGGATVSWTTTAAWAEAGYSDGGALGNFKILRTTPAITSEYILVLTAGCCDVYRATDGAWVACIEIPHTDAQVAEVKATPSLDTLILYHEDVPTHFVQRLGSDVDWYGDAVEFDSVVEFPFADENVSGGENEIQYLKFSDMSAGDRVQVEYNADTSDDFRWTATASTNASRLEAAIESLTDITAVSVTVSQGSGANADYEVEFRGVDAKKFWPVLVIDILTGTGTVEVSHKQYGKPDTDALWGVDRGYPSCGAFYQGRHWMGGFKARPDVLVGSRAGSLFDFREDAEPVLSSPIVVAPNIDDRVEIENIYAGRHLQIFGSSAEIYVPDEPITIDNIALKVTSRYGSSPNVSPVELQGGTLFIDRNGRALREYLYTDAQQSYSAEPVSFLAGHLVSSPRSLVLRRAADVDEPAMLLLANTGTDRSGAAVPAALCVIDRTQQVTAFARIKTQGTPLDFATSQAGEAFAVVQRDLAGATWNFLEQFDDAFMSDCSVSISGSGSTIDVSDYPWLEGQTVEVHGDGLPLGAFTVASGVIDLGEATYSAAAEVGLKQVPRIVTHPYKGRGEMSPTMTRQRIFRALLQLERTGAVAITARSGGTPKQVSLDRFDQGVMDPTLEEVLFTGPKRVSGLGGWQIEPTIEITQVEPMPFLLRALTFDIRY